MEFVLSRFDASGTPLWVRSASYWPLSYIYPPTASTPDGGFIGVSSRTTQLPDSSLIDVVKLDATGNLSWARSLVISLDPGAQDGPASVSVASTGHVFVVASLSMLSTVSKFDPNGNLLWTKRIWTTGVGAGMQWIVQAEPLDDGGCTFLGTSVPDNNGPVFGLGRLDQSGNLLWAKAFTYNAPNGVFEQPRLVTGANNQLIVNGPLSVLGVGAYHAIIRMDTLGQYVRADLYEHAGLGSWQHYAMVEQLGNGAVLLTGGEEYSTRGMVMRLDHDGTILSARKCRTTSIGQVQYDVNHLLASAQGDTITWAGNIIARDTIFGTEEYIPILWRGATDLSAFCGMDTLAVQHYEVPSGVITTADVGDTASVSYDLVSIPITSVPLPLPTVGSYCGLVGVQDQMTQPAFQVWPHPAPSNGPINIRCEESGTVELVDAAGRVIYQHVITVGTNRIEPRAHAGVYLLRFTSTSKRSATLPLLVQ